MITTALQWVSKLVLLNIYCIIVLTGGVDYDSGPYLVTFPAGVTRVSFAVVITNDNLLEGDEKFNLVIDPSFIHHRVTVSNPDHVAVTIYDDDGNLILNLYVCYNSFTFASSGMGACLNIKTDRAMVTTGSQLGPSLPLCNLWYI